jgi:hypothetical protein
MCSVTTWYIPCTCSTEFWFAVWVLNKSERQSSHSHVDWAWCLLWVSGSIAAPRHEAGDRNGKFLPTFS